MCVVSCILATLAITSVNWATAEHDFGFETGVLSLSAKVSMRAGLSSETVVIDFAMDSFVTDPQTETVEQNIPWCEVEAAVESLSSKIAVLAWLESFDLFSASQLVPDVSDLCDAGKSITKTLISGAVIVGAGEFGANILACFGFLKLAIVGVGAAAFVGASTFLAA